MFTKITSETFKKSHTYPVYWIGISVWEAGTLLLKKKKKLSEEDYNI